MTQADTSKAKDFEPVRFWLADPRQQERIYRPGSRKPLHFVNGALVVHSEKDADIVRRAMAGQAFEEDLPKSAKAFVCKQCGYAPRSNEAAQAHQDTHPKLA